MFRHRTLQRFFYFSVFSVTCGFKIIECSRAAVNTLKNRRTPAVIFQSLNRSLKFFSDVTKSLKPFGLGGLGSFRKYRPQIKRSVRIVYIFHAPCWDRPVRECQPCDLCVILGQRRQAITLSTAVYPSCWVVSRWNTNVNEWVNEALEEGTDSMDFYCLSPSS